VNRRSAHDCAGEDPVAMAVDAQTARAFVRNKGKLNRTGKPIGPGSAGAPDARSGAVLNTVRVGADPNAAAVDEATGRVFLLNGGAFNQPIAVDL
jgi:hypothetical protein